MATSKARKLVKVRTADELGRALGLSVSDTAEMEFRSELTVSLAKIIQFGRLTHADIAKRAGTSRTRVTAIANGNTHGVSTRCAHPSSRRHGPPRRTTGQENSGLAGSTQTIRAELTPPDQHHMGAGIFLSYAFA
jgi:predicted XRE-type DNA-binding protein